MKFGINILGTKRFLISLLFPNGSRFMDFFAAMGVEQSRRQADTHCLTAKERTAGISMDIECKR